MYGRSDSTSEDVDQVLAGALADTLEAMGGDGRWEHDDVVTPAVAAHTIRALMARLVRAEAKLHLARQALREDPSALRIRFALLIGAALGAAHFAHGALGLGVPVRVLVA